VIISSKTYATLIKTAAMPVGLYINGCQLQYVNMPLENFYKMSSKTF